MPPLVVLVGTCWLPSDALDGEHGRLRDLYGRRYRQVLASRETTWLLGDFIVMLASWSAFSVYLGAYLKNELRASANVASLVFLVSGVCFTLSSLIVPRLIERRAKRRVHAAFTGLLALNFLGVGSLYAGIPTTAVFVGVTAFLSVSLYLITGILLLDSLPAARGAVMALRAAGTEVGVTLGAAWGGAALVIGHNDYVAAYRSLALMLPFAALGLLLSARAVRRPREQATEGQLAASPGA